MDLPTKETRRGSQEAIGWHREGIQKVQRHPIPQVRGIYLTLTLSLYMHIHVGAPLQRYIRQIKYYAFALVQAWTLFRYIYKHFTPKREAHKLGETKGANRKTTKSLYKHALIHYHPDKQKQYGGKWVVICEEICKCLNNRYGSFKDVQDSDNETKPDDSGEDVTEQPEDDDDAAEHDASDQSRTDNDESNDGSTDGEQDDDDDTADGDDAADGDDTADDDDATDDSDAADGYATDESSLDDMNPHCDCMEDEDDPDYDVDGDSDPGSD